MFRQKVAVALAAMMALGSLALAPAAESTEAGGKPSSPPKDARQTWATASSWFWS